MQNIIIVCSGEDYSKEKLKKFSNNSDFIIAVDGGLKILDDLKIKPGLLVGDMDSIDKKILAKYKGTEKLILEREKDLTDSEVALKKAISLNPENIYIFASTGSYFDHSLANMINLVRNYKKNINIKLITGNSEIFAVKQNLTLENCIARRISIFPVTKVYGIKLDGFKYNFNKTGLQPSDYSISNVIIKKKAFIKIKKGMYICVLFDKNYE